MADPLAQYDPLFQAAGSEWGIDPTLLKAMARTESMGNPRAVSPAGAQGLMQIIPDTQQHLGMTDPMDPAQSIYGAAKYLSEARTAEGDNPQAALLYYHGGPDWRQNYGPESAAYVPKVAASYQVYAKAAPGAAAAAAPPGGAGGMTDDQFLKEIGKSAASPAAAPAVTKQALPSDADFLKELNASAASPAARATPPPAAAPNPDMTPGPPDKTASTPQGVNIPGVSGAPSGFDLGEIARAASEGYAGGALVTPAGVAAADKYGLGWLPRGINYLSQPAAAIANAGQDIFSQTAESVAPGLGREATNALIALPMGTHGVMPPSEAANPLAAGAKPGPRVVVSEMSAADREAFANSQAPPRVADIQTAAAAPPPDANALSLGPDGKPIPTMTVRPADATPQPQSAGAAASRDMSNPSAIPEPTPAQKATGLQQMVNQSAEDRLTPQGRDDATYFPGVVRPEAMRDFTPAAEGEMSSALQHKTLYNTDSNYHDQFDAQVKKNNTVMVDGLHDMFGDANAREAAMDDARDLMPGSVHLFDDQKPVDVQPIADKIKEIMAGPAGKVDGVANIMRKMGPKLQDAAGNPETLPSQIKGMFDDINNKLYDKSPTTEGNEARQASSQLKQLKAVVSDVIGKGLPGTKWSDYLTNLSGALGHVNKLDYMQQFLTGSKKLTDLSGNLQFGKVQKMLEDIQKHSTDQTGGARQMTMGEINKIEAVRNELAAKDLLDRRAGVRGSPTVQLANAAGGLGSGPVGAAIKGSAEAALHVGLAATTGGVGNAILGGYRFIVKPAVQAAKAQKAANALAATKSRLLSTEPNPLSQY